MHSVQNNAGRLIEIRVRSPLAPNEFGQFIEELKATAARIPGRYVAVSDLQQANVFTPEIAATLIQLLSQLADRVERAAFLVGDSAVLSLQIERVLRNAANPNRRTFRAIEPLKEWLGEILNENERHRVDGFFAASLDVGGGKHP
jgi:hypothetical protein